MFDVLLTGKTSGTLFIFVKYFKKCLKPRVGEDAKSFKTFVWILSHWLVNNRNDSEVKIPVEFYHLGHCMRCGRALTVPESIKNGLGSECSKRFK